MKKFGLYTKGSDLVSALKVGKNDKAVAEFLGDYGSQGEDGVWTVNTAQGLQTVPDGGWIVCAPTTDFLVVDDEAFTSAYAPVE